ncbi:DUF397 domain-containing protein [Streptomyces sp. ID05-04B]|uniref:DUF397 domain-containing protein n=1 Tax=unclassified Streptomyces TaxID=2593676 RepID=UPI000D1A5D6B|nr:MULTISPECIES: DUF397 domain-containing protein [unclassified Streptomyces]AVV40951.1 DUF397 domain-containing protein [Streptomyces sp. P3]MDX5565443.1 DUF397 domain-containing protein [Streptomyces sp. ID05-04B]
MKTGSPAPAAAELHWFKSSYSAGNGGDCVEVANTGTAVLVRDSKRPGDGLLTVGADEWAAFVGMAARG